MFEIGNSLREARLRQGLDLARAEADTKIRGKYLQALEDERFELLPAETYVKGFLRTYADYLGLDGQLYVDEFNSRFAASEEPIVAHRTRPRQRQRRAESHFVMAALAGIAAVTVLVIVAWQFGTGGGEPTTTEFAGTPPPPPAAAPPAEPAAPPAAAAPARRPAATIVFNAIQGNSWVVVHAGSATGELLFQGTLERGQSLRFVRKRLWVQYGSGEHLDVKVNGKRVERVPTGGAIVVITAKALRVVSTT